MQINFSLYLKMQRYAWTVGALTGEDRSQRWKAFCFLLKIRPLMDGTAWYCIVRPWYQQQLINKVYGFLCGLLLWWKIGALMNVCLLNEKLEQNLCRWMIYKALWFPLDEETSVLAIDRMIFHTLWTTFNGDGSFPNEFESETLRFCAQTKLDQFSISIIT